MSNKLIYGLAPGSAEPLFGATLRPFKASQVFKALSLRYVRYDTGDGYWLTCGDNEAAVGGFVMESGFTGSSTAGATKLPVIRNVGQCVFEGPYAAAGAAATLTQAVLDTLDDKIIDLYVASSIQYADNATTQHILRVHGGDVDNNTLYVSVMDADIGQAS
jgi:hypothetical protein